MQLNGDRKDVSVVAVDMFDLDMFDYMGDDNGYLVRGFPTLEVARGYARRRTRDSVEEARGGRIDYKEIWS